MSNLFLVYGLCGDLTSLRKKQAFLMENLGHKNPDESYTYEYIHIVVVGIAKSGHGDCFNFRIEDKETWLEKIGGSLKTS